MSALATLQTKLDEYGMRSNVTRIEFADTEQIAFLYQDRISVLLGTLNDLDYKLDRARYMLNNEDGKGCAATDTGRLDFSHVSAGSTRKIYFAQGDPVLPSGYVVPEKVEPETPEETADSSLTDEAAPQAAPTEDPAPEEIRARYRRLPETWAEAKAAAAASDFIKEHLPAAIIQYYT